MRATVRNIKKTFDWLIRGVHLTPYVAAPFAFLHIVANNIGSTGVGGR